MKKAIIILTLMIAIFAASVSALNITLYWNSTTGEYETPGEYISSTLDTGTTNVYYCELEWDEDTPANTDIVMQLRSGNSNPPTGNFLGSDGSTGTTYQSNPSWINIIHNTYRYMQWKSILSTTDTSVTPTLLNTSITYTTDGDSGTYDCSCVTRIGAPYQGECGDGEISCWDSTSGKCCGDDDDANDNFYVAGFGGCVNIGGVGTADKIPPTLISIDAQSSDTYYYVPSSATTGIVYFNSALAQGDTIPFAMNWSDSNSNLGLDSVNAIRIGGLAGGVVPNTGVPPKNLGYTFNAVDSSGSLRIYVLDAVHYNASSAITFTEDTIAPTGSVIINGGDEYTFISNVILTLSYSDDIGIRDCSFSNEGLGWSAWEPCNNTKAWRVFDADGTREVQFRVRDYAGNIHTSLDQINLDKDLPGVVINNGSAYTNDTSVTLSLDFNIMGGAVYCGFKNDSLSWTSWQTCPNTPTSINPEISWTLENIVGERMVSVRVNTSIEVVKEGNNTIIYDPDLPSGSLNIYSLSIPGFMESNENYTAYSTVNLELNYVDDLSGVKSCRYANEENQEANFTGWGFCKTFKTWILRNDDGLRTVYYQIQDNAGNVREYNDTIFLNKTGAGLDMTPPDLSNFVISDDGNWTNNQTSIHAAWFGVYDHESEILGIPLVYNYSIGTSAGDDDIVNWSYIDTDTEVTHNGLTLVDGQIYYVNIRIINSAGLFSENSSDGITLDITKPTFGSFQSSHDSGVWNNNSQINNPLFLWNCSDSTSGIYGYSYVLDQSESTVPDTIPEGIIGNYSLETSVLYNNIIDGILYFHVSCRDNAGNWATPVNYEIRIDASSPSTPQISEPNKTSNLSYQEYLWTNSLDPESGVKNYYFELYNDSDIGNSDYLFYNNTVLNNSIIIYSLIPNVTYYARVLAVNNAGLNSSWSSEVSTEIDQTGPVIDIEVPGETCNVRSLSPVIRVKTDESALCKLEANNITNQEFDYTDSDYHEIRTNLVSGGYFNVKCWDKINNLAEANRTFNIVGGGNIILDSMTLQDRYYTNTLIEFILDVDSNLGGVEESDITIDINQTTLGEEEFAVTDLGCGQYIISLEAPSQSASYPITIITESSTISSTLNITELKLNVSYAAVSLNKKGTGLDQITYAEKNNTEIGIATDSSYSEIQNLTDKLGLISNSYDGTLYLFASKGGANIGAREILLKNKYFETFPNPSFGSILDKEKYKTTLWLSFENISFSGIEELGFGSYNLLIKKTGFDPETGKNIIQVSIQDETD